MERVGVVTAVVMNSRGEILFLRRSSRVGTYRGRWACVSGHIESEDENALERAIKEVMEETALSKEDISEIRIGEVIEVVDTSLGRIWEVHPFLFILRKGAEKKVKIDWEHTEFMWSSTVPDDTVPELKKTVENAMNGKKLDDWN